MEELSSTISGSEETLSGTSPAVYLFYLSTESTMHGFMALVHETSEEGQLNCSDSDVRPTFVKSGYILGAYIPALRYVDLKSRCIGELEENSKNCGNYLLLKALKWMKKE